MNWPTSQDYNEAIQNAATAMSDPELKNGEATVNSIGLPVPRSGNFADVYQFKGASGTMWAVKCFTRHVAGLQARYTNIHDYLETAKLPFMVGFSYLAEGVRIRGQWYPILKMEWVEGFTLNDFVRQNVDKPNYLHGLMQMWTKLTQKLRDADIAHADLQHGNVLLVPGNTPAKLGLKLIDYDGMWVPPLAKTHSGEVGHPNFQHPLRLKDRLFNADVDRFPHLVIGCALRATLLGGKAFWDKFDNGDNLLFREQDLREPEKAQIFKALWNLNDNVVRTLVGNIALSSKQPLRKTPWLDDLLLEEDGPRLSPDQENKTIAMLGVSKPEPVAAKPASVAPEFTAFDVIDDDDEEERAPSMRDENDEDRERRARRLAKKSGKAKKKTKSSKLPVLIGGGALALVLIGVAVAVIAGRKKEPPATQVVENEPPANKSKVQAKNAELPKKKQDEPRATVESPKKSGGAPVVAVESAKKLPLPIGKWTFEKDASDVVGSMHGILKDGAVVANGKLILNGKGAGFISAPPATDIEEKTLEAWVYLPSLDKMLVVMQIRDEKGIWDGMMFADQQQKKWYPGSSYRHRSRNLDAPEENANPTDLVQIAIVHAANNSVTMYRNGKVYGSPFVPTGEPSTLRTYPKNISFVHIGGVNVNDLSGPFDVEEARLYNRALTADEIAESYRIGVELPKKKVDDPPANVEVPKKKPVEPVAFSDRRAAEYVLLVGGVVRLQKNPNDFKGVVDLPRVPFKLESVYLAGPQVNDAGLAVFEGCTSLTGLTLNSGNVSDAGVAHFKDCTKLLNLDLNGCSMVTDAGLKNFKECVNLIRLHLKETQVSDAGVEIFQNCKNLTDLCLWSTKVGDAGLAHCKDFKKLTLLYLQGTELSDAGLENFKNSKDLATVELSTTKIAGPGLQYFKDCNKLATLDLSRTEIGEGGLANLKDYKNLTTLILSGSKVTDSDLAVLSSCKKLQQLRLDSTQIGDDGLAHLKNCKSLKVLTLRETKVTPMGIGRLKIVLKQCTIE